MSFVYILPDWPIKIHLLFHRNQMNRNNNKAIVKILKYFKLKINIAKLEICFKQLLQNEET